MKKIQFILMIFTCGLFLTISSCDTEELLFTQEEEIMNESLIYSDISGKTANTSAYGQGNLIYKGQSRQFVFSASLKSDGSIKGSGTLIYPAGDSPVSFNISCMTIVGNSATLSGNVLKWKNYPERIGETVWFMVVDNGEGSDFNPDKISLLYHGWGPVDCTPDDEAPIFNIVSGNIQVK